MSQKTNKEHWLSLVFENFMLEAATKSRYEIVNVYECKKTGFTKAVIKTSKHHTIEENIRDIVIDNEFLKALDKKTIRALTYIATAEYLRPDYSIVTQKMSEEIDNYILEIKSLHNGTTVKKSPSEISKDKILIAKFNPVEANRIGYMAGMLEATMEYRALLATQ